MNWNDCARFGRFSWFGCLALCWLLGGYLSAEPAVTAPSLKKAGLENSDLLLNELNCVACHAADSKYGFQSIEKKAPLLGEVGSRITPQYLRSFLMNPHKVKPGTLMPDLLTELSPDQKKETVEDLVHFLSSLKRKQKLPALEADMAYIIQGEKLFHSVGCVACHDAQSEKGEKTSGGVPIVGLAEKMSVEYLSDFLMNPTRIRPSGRMPSLNLTKQEADAIAQYLLRKQSEGETKRMVVSGVKYKYYEFGGKNLNSVKQLFDMTPVATGSAKSFDISKRKRNDHFGFVFSGLIRIEKSGKYRFFTDSDDGSILWIGDREVVNNDGVHGGREHKGIIDLQAGDHPIKVAYFENAGGEHVHVRYEGPAISKRPIPSDKLLHIGLVMRPLGFKELKIDSQRAERGKSHFAKLGCASCHSMGHGLKDISSQVKGPSLAVLAGTTAEGCLSSKTDTGFPHYSLSNAQRAALKNVIKNPRKKAPSEKELVKRRLAALNCFQCHDRDGIGGPDMKRNTYFHPMVEVDLGDEGRIPPTLTGVGDKLKPAWFNRVLLRKGTARPYMATRMPQFGEASVGDFAEAIAKVDVQKETIPEGITSELNKDGRQLVGTKGMSCVTCHTYGQYKSLGIPAVDLATTAKRLRKDWFFRYVQNPQQYKPETRMPAFWEDGESSLETILDGNTPKQIDAIWSYLAKGESSRIPHGLVRIGQQLVPDDHALIYRHFIEGAGSRAIGVGYPEEVNLAWDANSLNIAMVWRGGFIDAQKHRSGRGAGFQNPAGKDILKLVGGVPLAILSSPDQKWPDGTAKTSRMGLRMRGYRLNKKREPTFMYTMGDIKVTDFPAPYESDVSTVFKRQLSITVPKKTENLHFRLARGAIEDLGQGKYRVDGKLVLNLKISNGGKAWIRDQGGSKELLVSVASTGETQIEETIDW